MLYFAMSESPLQPERNNANCKLPGPKPLISRIKPKYVENWNGKCMIVSGNDWTLTSRHGMWALLQAPLEMCHFVCHYSHRRSNLSGLRSWLFWALSGPLHQPSQAFLRLLAKWLKRWHMMTLCMLQPGHRPRQYHWLQYVQNRREDAFSTIRYNIYIYISKKWWHTRINISINKQINE